MSFKINGPSGSAIHRIEFCNEAPFGAAPGLDPRLNLLICAETHAKHVQDENNVDYRRLVLDLMQLAINDGEGGYSVIQQENRQFYSLEFRSPDALMSAIAMVDELHRDERVVSTLLGLNPCNVIADALVDIKKQLSDQMAYAVSHFEQRWRANFFNHGLKRKVPSRYVTINNIYLIVEQLEIDLRSLANVLDIELYKKVSSTAKSAADSLNQALGDHNLPPLTMKLYEQIFEQLRMLVMKTDAALNISAQHTYYFLSLIRPIYHFEKQLDSDSENRSPRKSNH